MQFDFLLDRLLLVTIAARVQVGGFSNFYVCGFAGESIARVFSTPTKKASICSADLLQFLNTLAGEMIMKQREANINIPISINWELYETLKKEIAETALTHEEYEQRIKALCKRMGV